MLREFYYDSVFPLKLISSDNETLAFRQIIKHLAFRQIVIGGFQLKVFVGQYEMKI